MYFGDGLHGVEAAALGFFGKHASDLTLAEAALLAGLVKSPSSLRADRQPRRAPSRAATVVLQAMVDCRRDAPRARPPRRKAEPVLLNDALARDDPHGAWFKEEVRRQLVARFGLERVYQGGLKVYTTIDLAMQQAAERWSRRARRDRGAPRAAPAQEDRAPTMTRRLQGALVAMDPRPAKCARWSAAASFEESRFNRAMQAKRQPGSAFKPFVFAAALEQGWSPASIIDRLDEPIQTLQGAWMPEDEHADAPEMTLRTALRTSSNRAAVRLLQEVGIAKTVELRQDARRRLGAERAVAGARLRRGDARGPDRGLRHLRQRRASITRRSLIRRVEDRDGTVIFEADPTARRASSRRARRSCSPACSSDVVNYGTAWKARRVGFMLPAAGKTGTTNDYVDAWFVGYTPKLVAGVWIGFDQPKTILAAATRARSPCRCGAAS